MKLLELMALTSVSMTLGLGIMDEPDQSSIETDAVSSLSVLIIAVNVVFALCMLFEIMVEVHKKVTKKLRTKELWASTRRKKTLLIAILKLGSPQCCDSSSDDSSDDSSTQSQSLTMAQKRRKTKKAQAAEGDGIEMSDLRTPEHGVQAGSLLHMSSLILKMGEYMSTVDEADKTDDLTSSSSDSDDDERENSQVMVRSNTRIGSMLQANKAAGRHW